MAALLALGGAIFWGVGDFLGGLATRRLHVVAVLVVSQTVGLAGVVVWVLLAADPFPGVVELLPAVGAGLAGIVGLGALYSGLAIGAMGIVAPISAAAPVIPLAVDAGRGDVPSVLQWCGVALILIGIATLSREPVSGQRRVATGVGLALVAAVGFGTFFVGLDLAADESVPWAVGVSRSTSVLLALGAALHLSTPLRIPRAALPSIAAIGVFDTGANVLIAFATTLGTVGIVAVLAALYPLTTILLARLVLGERLSAARRAGGAVALGGAALVAAG